MLLDLNAIITETTKERPESAELLQAASSRFFQINYPGSAASFPASITFLEQCYSLSYSLQTFSSKIPDLRLLDSRSQPLVEALEEAPARVVSLLFPL